MNAKIKPATVLELLSAFAALGPREVVQADTLRVSRAGKPLDVPVTRDLTLRALSSYRALRPDQGDLVDELSDFVRIHKRISAGSVRSPEGTLTIVWRGAAQRPVLQVPLSRYTRALDITPAPKGKSGHRTGEQTLRVEYLPDRIIVHVDRLATDAPVASSNNSDSDD